MIVIFFCISEIFVESEGYFATRFRENARLAIRLLINLLKVAQMKLSRFRSWYELLTRIEVGA